MLPQIELFEPLTEFEANLPYRPYYGEGKRIYDIMGRETARDFSYIQVNFPVIHYLCFDCDFPGAAIQPEMVYLPQPTLTVITPDSRHAHLMYQLRNPIPRRRKSRETNGLLRDVISAYKVMLVAHKCITTQHQLVKNPLCGKWDVIEGYTAFFLWELIDFVPPKVKCETKPEIPRGPAGVESLAETPARMEDYDSRNCAIFDDARVYAYSIVGEHGSYESLFEAVLGYIEELNEKQIPEHFPDKGKIFSFGELRSTAKSIADWTFARRSQFSKIDRGAMGFQPLEELHLKDDEYEREVNRRASLSAERTHRIQKETTKDKIRRGVELCLKRGFDPTPANVSTLGQVTKRAVYRHRDLLPKLDGTPGRTGTPKT